MIEKKNVAIKDGKDVKDEKGCGCEKATANVAKSNTGEFGFFRPFFSLFNDDFPTDFISNTNLMRTDIKDEGKDYRLDVEVPGIDKKDIKIDFAKGYLTIDAQMNKNSKEGSGKYVHTERVSGAYSRSYFVGYDVKRSDISASLADGLLTVTVIKPVENKVDDQPIEIK
ncbi:MAG: Hsp20 family protein [Bacilli bacterium]|jgi:HSP20 family molecular chaperone IbpA